jgi:hypothetical protein
MRNKKLRLGGEARNLSRREARQTVMPIIRQIEEMEYKEQAVKTGAWSTGLEGRVVGHGSEKVGEKRLFRDACDTGRGESGQAGPHGEGGKTLKDQRQKETKHKQEGVQKRGKRRLWRRERSEGAGTAGKAQRGEGVGVAGEGVGVAGEGGGAVKKGSAKCPHNRRRSTCK